MSIDYKELYKKYRPMVWDDIIGQDTVVRSLKTAVSNDTIPTAYGFFGSHGCGKALHKDTIIPTPSGFKTMGSIEIGDYVLGSDSSPVKIINKYCPNDPVSYNIVFQDRTSVKTSAGHLWEVESYNNLKFEQLTILTTDEMFKNAQNNDYPGSSYTIKSRTIKKIDYYNYHNELFKEIGIANYDEAIKYIMKFISSTGENLFHAKLSSFLISYNENTPEIDKLIKTMRTLGGIVTIKDYNGDKCLEWSSVPSIVYNSLCEIKNSYNDDVFNSASRSHIIKEIVRIDDNPLDYYCISVDAEDELFLCTESFIPTHNTSTARVLAKALNCTNLDENIEPCNICDSCQAIEEGTSLDVTYRSMANAGSTDDVRELCRQAMLQPSGNKAVYILDEVHNLSKAAFDALLIPLEDYSMPSVFILCSTSPDKIPATVLSRIQTRNFTPIKPGEMFSFIQDISEKESLEIGNNQIKEIIRRGRGSARDTLTLLDKFISEGDFSSAIKNEMDFAKSIVRELFIYADDLTCTVKAFEKIDEAEKTCDLESILVHMFKVARAYIVNLEGREKKSIGARDNAFEFLQDVMILSSEALDKSRRSNGLDIRIFVDNIVVSLIRKHPLSV